MSHFHIDGANRLVRVSGPDCDSACGRLACSIARLNPLRPAAEDLLRVAAAVYHVDRLAPRPSRRSEDFASIREIEVEVEVTSPEVWAPISERISALLRFMTDDQWHFRFAPATRRSPVQRSARESWPEHAHVALFSGGLDSVVGAFVAGQAGTHQVAVSASGIGVRRSFVSESISTLQTLGTQLQLAAVENRLEGWQHRTDPLMRARAFFFWAAGAVAADGLGVEQVHAYETGVGSLNLPMNPAQIASQNTRAMHPRTLMMLEEIFALCLGRRVRLELPFFFDTKGELCGRGGALINQLAAAAQSCDQGEGHKRDAREHCGVCTSCLYRSAALHATAAGDSTKYLGFETRRTDEYDVRAFEHQAITFSAWKDWNDLLRWDPQARHVEKYFAARGIPADEVRVRVLSLLERHAFEVLKYFEHERPAPSKRPVLVHKEPTRDLFETAR